MPCSSSAGPVARSPPHGIGEPARSSRGVWKHRTGCTETVGSSSVECVAGTSLERRAKARDTMLHRSRAWHSSSARPSRGSRGVGRSLGSRGCDGDRLVRAAHRRVLGRAEHLGAREVEGHRGLSQWAAELPELPQDRRAGHPVEAVSVCGADAERIVSPPRPILLRAVSAQVSLQRDAGCAERTEERENPHNGYRVRSWDPGGRDLGRTPR